MLGKLTGAAAEISGTADITSVVRPSEFGQAESLMFVFTEDGETPQFILRSKRDEYCWTDRAFVHLDGTSALSKKRLVKRYLYKDYHFQNVLLETAGTIDLDVEIKFGLRGGPEYSIDIRKTEMAALTCLYKALMAISEAQATSVRLHGYATQALGTAKECMPKMSGGEAGGTAAALEATTQAAFSLMQRSYEAHVITNFGATFQKYVRWG